MTDLRDRARADALPRLRSALQLNQLPTRLALRLDAHGRAQRVR